MITGREELSLALGALSQRCNALNAIVIDTQSRLYGLAWHFGEREARPPEGIDLRRNEAVAALAPKTLLSGGRLDVTRTEGPPFFVARSFAGVYTLLLWFSSSPAATGARRHINKALPNIEAHTLRTPTDEGPWAGAVRLPVPRG